LSECGAGLRWSRAINGDRLEEIGLLKEVLAGTFNFNFASLRIVCQEQNSRSIQRRHFFRLTNTGAELARIICPEIVGFTRCLHDDPDQLHEWIGPIYLDERDAAESLILPKEVRIKKAVAAIVSFVMEISAIITIDKRYVDHRGVTDVANILTIRKQSPTEMNIKRSRKGRALRELHSTEVQFMESLATHLEANRTLICNPG